ncbi:MAG: sulfite exporter TauE/SafE family protein [Saprospiraceae bacterium]|nr:sulfite exporter TauE/SafE family protein [Saprospiraceae bacterium]
MEWYVYVIAIVGSAVAGAINTLAGNGSAITLTILTELIGLPGNVANATNRVGVWTQSMAGGYAFYKNGKLNIQQSGLIIIATVIGAVIGIVVAIYVSNEQFMGVFRFLLAFMLLVILVKPKRWLRETDNTVKFSPWLIVPVFLALGFYGGFIQMGMGVFYLAAMVLGARYSLIDSNAVKIVVVAIYTFFALIIFQYRGLIDWPMGLLMASGQTVGGYFTAYYASRYPQANIWAHRVLIVVVILALIKLFNLHTLFW